MRRTKAIYGIVPKDPTAFSLYGEFSPLCWDAGCSCRRPGAGALRGARILIMDDAKPEARRSRWSTARSQRSARMTTSSRSSRAPPSTTCRRTRWCCRASRTGHNHLIWSATQAEDIGLTDVADEAGLRAAIEPAMATLPEGAWLRGGGWSIAVYQGRLGGDARQDHRRPAGLLRRRRRPFRLGELGRAEGREDRRQHQGPRRRAHRARR